MRELSNKEMTSVSGGNPLFAALQLAGAFQAGLGRGQR